MRPFWKKTTIIALSACVFIVPAVVFAQGLVPCGGPGEPQCTFNHLIILAQTVINFLILNVAAPLAGIVVAWAGILMFTSGGNQERLRTAKKIFWYVILGFVVALSAWLIVNAIVFAFVDQSVFDPTPYIN